jgi:hypothetical protein
MTKVYRNKYDGDVYQMILVKHEISLSVGTNTFRIRDKLVNSHEGYLVP